MAPCQGRAPNLLITTQSRRDIYLQGVIGSVKGISLGLTHLEWVRSYWWQPCAFCASLWPISASVAGEYGREQAQKSQEWRAAIHCRTQMRKPWGFRGSRVVPRRKQLALGEIKTALVPRGPFPDKSGLPWRRELGALHILGYLAGGGAGGGTSLAPDFLRRSMTTVWFFWVA